MHFQFQRKLNKIASEQYPNIVVPMVDTYLNEAVNIFVKRIAEPRLRPGGAEKNQRTIDDIRTLVKTEEKVLSNSGGVYTVALPEDYMFHLSSEFTCKKDNCRKTIRGFVAQHDDLVEETAFTQSSFEWEEVNFWFAGTGIKVKTKDFTPVSVIMDYIKTPARIYFADGYGGQYVDFDGNTLTGSQDCDLPAHTHDEIVDIAVLLAIGELSPDYNVAQNKVENLVN